MTAAAEQTTPRRPALRYFGGKWLLAKWIIEHLPPHRCYVEPFGGGANVLLRKPPSKVEVYNDISGEVVRFFRVLRERPADLVEVLRLTPYAAAEFAACAEPCTDDDLEAARRFFVRSWQAIGGTPGVHRPTGWRRTADRAVAPDGARAVENIFAAAARLRDVAIDCLDWRAVLERYDRHDTVFLKRTRLRSWSASGYGANELTDGDHLELLDRICAVRGRVVLSGYSSPTYDLRLAGWQRVERIGKRQKGDGGLEVLWISPERRAA